MKGSRKLFSFAIAVFVSIFFIMSIHAQVNDAGLWISTSVEKKINSKLSFTLNPALRFNENITELGSAFGDGGVEYKINKKIRVSLNYRLIARRKLDESYGYRNRFYADFSYRKKIQKFVIGYRLRILNQYTEIFSSEKGTIPNYALRNKIQVKYETDTKYSPFVSGELWYQFNYRKNEFSRCRISGGVEMEINKFNALVISYIFQRDLNTEDPWTDYITSIGYNFSF